VIDNQGLMKILGNCWIYLGFIKGAKASCRKTGIYKPYA